MHHTYNTIKALSISSVQYMYLVLSHRNVIQMYALYTYILSMKHCMGSTPRALYWMCDAPPSALDERIRHRLLMNVHVRHRGGWSGFGNECVRHRLDMYEAGTAPCYKYACIASQWEAEPGIPTQGKCESLPHNLRRIIGLPNEDMRHCLFFERLRKRPRLVIHG